MFAGRWLDGRLGSEPWLLLAGAFLGMAVGFYTLFKKVALTSRKDGGDTGSRSDR
jgi:F0F1-type ATP synthase assembly protein I